MKKIIIIVMMLAGVCLGATKITCEADTGLTAYAVIYNTAIALYEIDAGSPGFEAEATATWTECDIAMTEATNLKGLYTVAFPAIDAGRYYVRVYSQLGETPANTDTVIGYDIYDFDGTNEIKNGDNTWWLGTACATPTVAGVPEVDMTHINGLATNDNLATLKLKQLNITNADDDAVVFTSTKALKSGMRITGSGTSGEGIVIAGSLNGLTVSGSTGVDISGNITGNITGNLTGSIGSLATQAKADVQAEVEAADLSSSTVGTVNALGTQAKADVKEQAQTAVDVNSPAQNLSPEKTKEILDWLREQGLIE